MNIRNLFGLQDVKYFASSEKLENTKFGLYEGIVGIEVEVENFVKPEVESPQWETYTSANGVWKEEKDGSLKNHGIEFISRPLKGRGIDKALILLSNILTCSRVPVDFSHRTSVHVHLNVLDLSMEQVVNLITVYAACERLFFSRTHKTRHGNSFCYPLTDTNPEDPKMVQLSQNTKYCAFNTAPIKRQGTVEFRHLHGTGDREELSRWIQMILKLRDYVVSTPSDKIVEDIHTLNTTSHYAQFVNSIFHPLGSMFSQMEYQSMMEYEIAWAKTFLHTGGAQMIKNFGGPKTLKKLEPFDEFVPPVLEGEPLQEPDQEVEF